MSYPQQGPGGYPGQQQPQGYPGYAPPQTPPPGFAAPGQPYAQPYPQQQQYGYPAQGGGYPQPSASSATAIIAGILSLAVAVCLGGAGVAFLSDVPFDLGNLPGGAAAILYGRFALAALALLGAILIFARQTAGAVLALIAAALGALSIVLEPMISEMYSFRGVSMDLGTFLEALFKFKVAWASLLAVGLVVAPLTIVFCALPTTFRWFRARHAAYPQPY
ncbi:hypothetical protein [Actinokineospora enzanensis]|uniref:hypothetical protein n=1 Tax=Actinokineospora enzanensis TaxID=155975 RepID=UPI00039F7557|nr:hypothetical protein [Actinokineospora enzanensis]